jgi:hypothetical protein
MHYDSEFLIWGGEPNTVKKEVLPVSEDVAQLAEEVSITEEELVRSGLIKRSNQGGGVEYL